MLVPARFPCSKLRSFSDPQAVLIYTLHESPSGKLVEQQRSGNFLAISMGQGVYGRHPKEWVECFEGMLTVVSPASLISPVGTGAKTGAEMFA